MAANLQVLVDSLDEGMLIVSPEGVVRLANQAARRFFTVVVGERLAVEELMVQVAAAVRGYIRLPFAFEIAGPEAGGERDRLHLKLMESPLGGGYLVIIRNISEQARYEHIISNFANLMTVELGLPMTTFATRLGRLLVDLVPDLAQREALGDDARSILQQGESIASRVTQLAAFAQLFAGKARAVGSNSALVDGYSVREGKNKKGPSMFGVVGRKAAAVPDAVYSDALKGSGLTWTPDKLDAYLAAPKKFVPGGKMKYDGLAGTAERANLLAYLATLR